MFQNSTNWGQASRHNPLRYKCEGAAYPDSAYPLQPHRYPDSKIHVANMGPTRGRQDPAEAYVDPMNHGYHTKPSLTLLVCIGALRALVTVISRMSAWSSILAESSFSSPDSICVYYNYNAACLYTMLYHINEL